MYRMILTVMGIVLASQWMPENARAVGNVLLPSVDNNSNSSSEPSLGLSVPSSPPPVSSPPLTPPSPPLMQPPIASSSSAPLQEAQSSLMSTSAPPAPLPNIVTTLDPAILSKLPKGIIPTTIIHAPDISPIFNEANKNLPNQLTIAIGSRSIFGAKDVDMITKKLGLSRDQISSACLLTVRGLLQTDRGSYIIDGGLSPQVNIHYSGMIQNYIMSATAFCRASNLPLGSGFLTETGDRFSIPLQQIKCSLPSRQVNTVTITYTGDASSQCVYQ